MTYLKTYPTGNREVDNLVEYIAARLPVIHKPDMTSKPSLKEEWWLEEIGDRPCPVKQGWSFVYRFARDRAVMQGRASDGAADLLAHQITELLPIMLSLAFAMVSQELTENTQ